ncbi:MAG: tyrosine-type recombinase/integrase [Acidobacteria bacterium]|nr:tyrosine-type recombinase/integrase [Acidobacteriota bacterium]
MTNKTAAQQAETIRKAALLERRAGIARKPLPPKFEEYVPKFLAWSKQQHRDKTYKLHRTNCHLLLRYFTGKYLDDITSGMVEDFKLARIREVRSNARDGRAVTSATVNRALTTLRLMFNHAARGGLAVSNPTTGVTWFDEGPGRMRIITFEEEMAYLQAASQPLRDIARIMLDTGMRPEEVFRIEFANLNFDRWTIFNPLGKTPAAKRTVPMTEEVWNLLKSRAIAVKGRYVFPSPKNPDTPIKGVRKGHDKSVARARIEDHFKLYDLRHTYATRAVMGGVDLPTLAALLGHTSISMTMRYVHPAEEHKREAVGKLENFKFAEARKLAERVRGSLQFPLQ